MVVLFLFNAILLGICDSVIRCTNIAFRLHNVDLFINGYCRFFKDAEGRIQLLTVIAYFWVVVCLGLKVFLETCEFNWSVGCVRASLKKT